MLSKIFCGMRKGCTIILFLYFWLSIYVHNQVDPILYGLLVFGGYIVYESFYLASKQLCNIVLYNVKLSEQLINDREKIKLKIEFYLSKLGFSGQLLSDSVNTIVSKEESVKNFMALYSYIPDKTFAPAVLILSESIGILLIYLLYYLLSPWIATNYVVFGIIYVGIILSTIILEDQHDIDHIMWKLYDQSIFAGILLAYYYIILYSVEPYVSFASK